MKILVNDFAGHSFQLQLSRALAASGYVVRHTYFGANNTPKGRVSGDARNLQITDVNIGREFHKHSLLKRRGTDIAYGKSLACIINEFRPNVVLSANTPLDAQRLALAATKRVQGKFIFWLQDLLSIGIEFVLRKKHFPFTGIAGSYYRRMERRLLKESDAVVCIAPEFRALLEKWNVRPEKTVVIENWASLDEIRPLSRSNPWARENKTEGRFCFMYSGTLGMKHKPELLLELARQCESRGDAITVVIAGGKGADWLKEHSSQVSPEALRLLPFQPYERLSEVLSSSDVLISLLDEDCGEFAVPSKTLTYLCAGRPLLIASPLGNLAARIVSRAGAGIAVKPVVSDFLAAANALIENSGTRASYGEKAREYAEKTFDIERITKDFCEVFASLRY